MSFRIGKDGVWETMTGGDGENGSGDLRLIETSNKTKPKQKFSGATRGYELCRFGAIGLISPTQ